MNKLTKFGLIVLSITSIVTPAMAIISCGSDKYKSSNADLVVWAMKSEQQGQANEVAIEASKDLGYSVGWAMVGGSRNYRAELAAAFTSGKGPTVFSLEKQTDVDSNKDRLYDFNSSVEGRELIKDAGIGDILLSNNHQVAIPMTQEVYGTLVNTKLLKDNYKITLNNSKGDNSWISDSMTFDVDHIIYTYDFTADNWTNLFKAISTKAGKEEQAMIFTLKPGSAWITDHSYNALAGAVAGTRLKFNGYKNTFESVIPEENFKTMVNAYKPYMLQKSTDEAITLLAGGKTVANQQGSWMQVNVAKVSNEVANKGLALLPLPVGAQGAGKIPVGIPHYWGIDKNAGADKIKKGLNFLKWLYMGKGKDDLQNTLQLINPYRSGTAPTANLILTSAADYIKDGQTYPWVMDMFKAKFNSVNTVFMDAWRNFANSSGTTLDIKTLYTASKAAYKD